MASSRVEVAGNSESLLVDLLFDLPVWLPYAALGVVASVAGDLVKEGLGLVVEGLRLDNIGIFLNLSLFHFILVLRGFRGLASLLLLVVQRSFLGKGQDC